MDFSIKMNDVFTKTFSLKRMSFNNKTPPLKLLIKTEFVRFNFKKETLKKLIFEKKAR